MDRRTDALPTKLVYDHKLSLSPGANVGTSVSSLFVRRDYLDFQKLTSGPRLRYLLPPIPIAHLSHLRHCCRQTLRLAHEAEAIWLKAIAFYPICAQRMLCLDNQ